MYVWYYDRAEKNGPDKDISVASNNPCLAIIDLTGYFANVLLGTKFGCLLILQITTYVHFVYVLYKVTSYTL